jgi:hypothetical protein
MRFKAVGLGVGWAWTEFILLGEEQLTTTFKHGDKTPGFVKFGEMFEYLKDHCLLKTNVSVRPSLEI